MQSSFIGSLMEIAQSDERVLYLTADSGEGGLDKIFRHNFPERALNFGIAEENMVAAAAGLATCGRIPFVYTAAPFLVYRALEFIRDDVCLQNLPVKLVGSGSGISVSALGPTHHTTEDIGVLRSIPNLTILSPATPQQAYESIKAAYRIEGPVYVRLGMNKEKEFFDNNYSWPGNSVETLRVGADVVIFTTGSILEEVMDAAELLTEEGINSTVINVPTIKPFDIKGVLKAIEKTGIICVVEEHNVIGGLASALADTIIDSGYKIQKMCRIGLNDCFSSGYGRIKPLRQENGIDAISIKTRIEECMHSYE